MLGFFKLNHEPADVDQGPVAREDTEDQVAPTTGRIVIEIGKDRRVIVDAGVDAAALARVLTILERR